MRVAVGTVPSSRARVQGVTANHFIKRTVSGMLRMPPTAAHGKRYVSEPM